MTIPWRAGKKDRLWWIQDLARSQRHTSLRCWNSYRPKWRLHLHRRQGERVLAHDGTATGRLGQRNEGDMIRSLILTPGGKVTGRARYDRCGEPCREQPMLGEVRT